MGVTQCTTACGPCQGNSHHCKVLPLNYPCPLNFQQMLKSRGVKGIGGEAFRQMYKLTDQKLGSGKFGNVVLARSVENPQLLFAVKVMQKF